MVPDQISQLCSDELDSHLPGEAVRGSNPRVHHTTICRLENHLSNHQSASNESN